MAFHLLLQSGSPDHTIGQKQLSRHGGIKAHMDHPAQEVWSTHASELWRRLVSLWEQVTGLKWTLLLLEPHL